MSVFIHALHQSPFQPFGHKSRSFALALDVIEGLLRQSGIERASLQSLFLGSPVMHEGADIAQRLAQSLGIQARTCTLSSHLASGYRALQLGLSECESQQESVLVAHLQGPSEAPYVLPKARWGQRFGECELLDSLELEGWQDLRDGASAMLLSPSPHQAMAQILTLKRAQDLRHALGQSLQGLDVEGFSAIVLGPGMSSESLPNALQSDYACPIRQIQVLLDHLLPQSYGCAFIEHQGCIHALTLKTV